MNVFEGKLVSEGLRVGIVCARFNEFITSKLLSGALDGLTRHGVADADILQRRAAKLREFRALALRMDRLRIEALARAEEFMSSQRPS